MSAQLQNSNKWETRTMVTMALLAAIAALLSFIEGGNFGGFLNYDASFVPAIIGGFVLGPIPGCVIGAVSWLIHMLIKGDYWGTLMNVCSVIAFVVPAALIYKRNKTTKNAIIGLAVGTVASVIVMFAMNMVVTPIYTGMTAQMIFEQFGVLILIFNILKALVNSVLAFFLYKPVSNMVKPVKEQVGNVQVR